MDDSAAAAPFGIDAAGRPAEPIAREREWLIPVALIVAIEFFLWWVSFISGRAFRPMILGYGAMTFLAMALVVCVRLLGWLRDLRKNGKPVPPPFEAIRANLPQLVAIFVGFQLIILGACAFGSVTAAMPKTIPFWLDPPLASAESWIFGLHPWQITHAIFGWATPAIDWLYATFVPVQLIAPLVLLTARPSALKSRALIALSLAWLLIGVGGAYLFASGGPIFYDRILGGDTFGELTVALADSAPITVKTADLLWHFHQFDVPAIANGIAAMPSMHVALALWLALVLRGTQWAPVAWTYFALTWFGSVHLGWHYVSDGLVASIAMLLIWRAAPALVWRERSLLSRQVSIATANSDASRA